jgi:predicted  nucleic acid-binding Zn-ribbon protein
MRTTNLLFISVLAISITGFCSVPLPAQEAVPSSGTDMKDMKPQMEQMDAQMKEMRTQMVQLQALMKDSMDKMAAAEAAMKTHMETEQSSMKSQMALQHAVIDHLQTMADHMQAMADCMAMMPGPMGIHKKTGEKMKKEKGMMGDQK